MYNVLKDLKKVFETLNEEGFINEVSKTRFVAELKRETGVFNDKTLSKWIKNFEEMGYLRIINLYTFQLCVDFYAPYDFDKITEIKESSNIEIVTPKKTDKEIRADIKKEVDNKIKELKRAKTKIEV